jgi:hypothetical protein
MNDVIALPKGKIITVERALFALAFCVPMLFNGSQVATGVIVNTVLFIAATRVSKQTAVFLAVIPSLGAVSHGVLFGAFTIYLVYFLPFIWIGNYFLMRISKHSNMLIAAVIKSLFLFSVAYIFVSFHIVPKIFLTAMGVLQLITAVVGGIVATGISTYILKKPANE